MIPEDAERPADGRVSSGKYFKQKAFRKKALPVGTSDYVRASSEYYYVDKTLLIKEFLDRKPLVSLFTRPRSFEKTLNMDMLRVFFEISDEDTRQYFEDKEIWKCGEEYRRHQGQYPVIYLTFKDVKFDSREATFDKLGSLLQNEFGRLSALLKGEKLIARIDQNVVYRSLLEDPASVYSLLFMAGYLKALSKELQIDGSYLCEITIPNREIAAVYKKEILSHFMQTGAITQTTANKIAESLYTNDLGKLQSAMEDYMNKSISFYDAGAEGFYHGFVLGLIALMDQQYEIRSNRESGDGRYDICLFPRKNKYPGIIMELKWQNNLSEENLKNLSEKALKQIRDKGYELEMKNTGITEILRLGIAFSGKHTAVAAEKRDIPERKI